MIPLRERARHKWSSILPMLGVDSRFLSGKHGPCPMCAGKDRWRFDNKEGLGTWFCTNCGAGDGVKLVMVRNCYEFREAAKMIEELIGSAHSDPVKPKRGPDESRETMNRLWRSGKPLEASSAAARYLTSRTGSMPSCRDLRAAARMSYHVGAGIRPDYYSGLIAMIRDAVGDPVNLHRTYLDAQGRKAAVEKQKLVMWGADLPPGCAIRLTSVAEEMGVAEGIETALSASAMFDLPVWSAINADILSKWSPPAEVKRVVVFGDNDVGCAGQAAAFSLAKRLKAKGLNAEVCIPSREGADWNDEHMQTRSSAA